VCSIESGPAGVAEHQRARQAVTGVLRVLQAFLTDPGWDGSRLVVTTRQAAAAQPSDVTAVHGVGSVLLASRQGPAASGAVELSGYLRELGARVEVVACDVADRDQVRDLLTRVPRDAPLTGVVHTAGVLDDATITSLEPGQVDAVFRPKVDAAVHLDDLTRDLDLAAFVLFSLIAGVLGNAGQGN
jgi:nucleoside-diphosphate-sugar epimerase